MSHPPGRPAGGVAVGPSDWLDEGDATGEAVEVPWVGTVPPQAASEPAAKRMMAA